MKTADDNNGRIEVDFARQNHFIACTAVILLLENGRRFFKGFQAFAPGFFEGKRRGKQINKITSFSLLTAY
jgi:hypothetical protein